MYQIPFGKELFHCSESYELNISDQHIFTTSMSTSSTAIKIIERVKSTASVAWSNNNQPFHRPQFPRESLDQSGVSNLQQLLESNETNKKLQRKKNRISNKNPKETNVSNIINNDTTIIDNNEENNSSNKLVLKPASSKNVYSKKLKKNYNINLNNAHTNNNNNIKPKVKKRKKIESESSDNGTIDGLHDEDTADDNRTESDNNDDNNTEGEKECTKKTK